MLPLHTVEKKGFQQLVETLDPQYDLSSSKYFSNTAIPGLFEKTKEKVFGNLQSAEYFSATVDMWSSVTSEPYFLFQGINKGGNIRRFVIIPYLRR